MSSLSRESATWDFGEYADEPPKGLFGDFQRQSNDVCTGSDFKLKQLLRTIEGEIIPRLMLTQQSSIAQPSDVAGPANVNVASALFDTKQVEEFSRLVLQYDQVIALSYIEALRAKGASLESIYLDLLAPSARRLGEYWEEDICDFTEVTIGLCCLHQVLHQLSPGFHNQIDRQGRVRRILLVPVQGEQHIFGLLMVSEFFRRAGWDVWSNPSASSNSLIDIVRSEEFDMIGFSASSDKQIDLMSATIRSIRRKSCRQTISVLVGGRVFNEHPDLAAMVGADLTASDGRQAVLQAENLQRLLSNKSK